MKKILCFGDSLTEGWINGGKAFHSYAKKLSELLNKKDDSHFSIINAGLSGEKVYCEMFERLPKLLFVRPNRLLNRSKQERVLTFVVGHRSRCYP